METRHYHLELTEDERGLLGKLMEKERKARERLADELDSIPGGVTAHGADLAKRQRDEAKTLRKVEDMRGEDEPRKLARRLLYVEHHSMVTSYARDAIYNILDGTIPDRDALETWLHETVNECQSVIYTGRAWDACYASENADACEDETGERPESIEVQAFYAIRADVQERLSAMVEWPDHNEGLKLPEGFDLQDDSTWRPAPVTADVDDSEVAQ